MRRSLPLLLLFILTAPALAQVAIHEILYDGVGTDPDDVFTELTGPARLRLDGWSLEAVNGGTGEVYRSIPLDDVEIPADGVLLIATSSATGVVLEQRDLIASVDWQNGPDAVRLVDPDGQIADALQYGDAAEHNAGEGMPAATTAAGQSLSRDDLGTDTGDNAADFTISTPTPGAAIVPLPPGATLSLPDTLGRPGQLLDLPLLVSGNGAGLLAAEVAVIFDAQLLIPVTVTPAVQTSTWQIAAHVTQGEDWQDTLRIALATDVDTLAGDAVLLRLTFRVADERSPATAALRLAQAVLDDGTTAAGLVDGSLLRVGYDAVLSGDASGFALPQRLMLQVEDPDEDRTEGIDTVYVALAEGDTVETLALVEDGNHSALFAGIVEARHAAVIRGDGIVQMRPRQPTRACYVDHLTAIGTTEPVCMEWIARGHDATIQVSHAIEPGDTLWFRVRDQDLDR
ncbi:MAG: hypothetical protein HN404_20015, partial [Gemmatimonadetes bacterium]|nr:hypothetical protein [Gemmatimonadota bacterium]